MSFLIFDQKEEKVKVTEDGWGLKEVMDVYNSDKTGSGKSFFNNVITAIFFIFKPDGIYQNKTLTERISIVDTDHLPLDVTWEDLQKKLYVRNLVEKYKELSYTLSQRLLDGVNEDIVKFLAILNDVPYTQTIKFTHTFSFDQNGDKQEKEVEKLVDIPNMDAKNKAYQSALSLSKVMRDLKINLREEILEREKEKVETRMWDRSGTK